MRRSPPFEGVFLELGYHFNSFGYELDLGDGRWLDVCVWASAEDDRRLTEQLAREWLPQLRLPELEASCVRTTGEPCPPLQFPELREGPMPEPEEQEPNEAEPDGEAD